MPSTLEKIFGRRGSDASNVSYNSVDSDESFQCQGIPADLYDPIYDSPEEIARRSHREELSRRAVYTGYEHVHKNVLPPPPNYYIPPPPLAKRIGSPEEMEILRSGYERPPHSAPAQTRRRAATIGEESPSKSRSAPARRVMFNDTVEFLNDTPRSNLPPEEAQSAPSQRIGFGDSKTEEINPDENQNEEESANSAPAHVTQFDDLTDSEEPDSEVSKAKSESLRRKLAHRQVRFHAGFDSRLAINFPQFPIDRDEVVESSNQRTLTTSRSDSALRGPKFHFHKPKFLKTKKQEK
ncbi:hypothetical protein DFH28DRAFT_405271 [Melampsora americana]|nr:hypothetical protein DFH28DRAFT_405271 [Melampsora americana]